MINGFSAKAPPSAQGVWLLTIVAAVALLTLHSETLASMIGIWLASETYAHGFLIAPISVYLIVTQRALLSEISPRVQLAGFALTVVLTLGWVGARLTGVLVVEQLFMVSSILALAWTVLGSRVFGVLAFPLGFLLFAVPFGEFLVPVLMEWTASITVSALQMVAIPVYREGMYFSIPSGNFEVAKACSGIRYLIAALTVGVLFAYLNYQLWWKRLAFVGLALVIPIIANGVRAFGIVMIAHLSDMQLAVGVDHLIYGWLFFGVVMVLLFAVGHTFRDPVESAVHARVSGYDVCQYHILQKPWVFTIAALASLAIVAAGLLGAERLTRGLQDRTLPVIQRPVAQGDWSHGVSNAMDWQPAFSRADRELHTGYVSGSGRVDLHIYAYEASTQDKELISVENRLADGDAWIAIESTERPATIDGTNFSITETELRSANRSLLVWHWFDVDGAVVNHRFSAKLHHAWNLLRGNHDYSALVALATEIDATRESSRLSLTEFLKLHTPGIK